ncbi:MAG: Sigma-54 factor interaction protein, partial [Bacteroidetes bacterium]|nr:Sigma-54 factor interaction protein [Bacteroidota bacterium]
MTRQYLLVSLSIALLSLLLVIAFHAPLSSVEEQVTALKYKLRGEQPADTNIVIVYIDNDAVRDLGRPVRRNFIALMVKALMELNVRAIGIDVMFEEPKPEYPEYDELFAATVAQSNRVVLASYFRSLSDQVQDTGRQSNDALSFPGVKGIELHGVEFHQPLETLRGAAAGIGFVNLGEGLSIPVFVQSTTGIAPSFGMEVLRVFKGVNRSEVSFENGIVSVGSDTKFPASDGRVSLNFPGPINSFRAYPFVEVLKSYDAVRLDRTPSLPVGLLSNKIVLVSFVADERVFVNTPVAGRYPSIGLHATFLDNALHSRFLSQPGSTFLFALSFLLGLCCAG